MDRGYFTSIFVILIMTVLKRSSSQGNWNDSSKPDNKQIMKSLCQYVGVNYVKNPDAPLCTYIKCEKNETKELRCKSGLRVAPHFMWGETYPCTQSDIRLQCDAYQRYIKTRRDRRKQQYMYKLQQAQAARSWQMEQKRLAEELYGKGKDNTVQDNTQDRQYLQNSSNDNSDITQNGENRTGNQQVLLDKTVEENNNQDGGKIEKLINHQTPQLKEYNSMINAGMPVMDSGHKAIVDNGLNNIPVADSQQQSTDNTKHVQINNRPNVHTVDVNIPEGTPIDMNKLIQKLNEKLFSVNDKNRANNNNNVIKGDNNVHVYNSGGHNGGQLYSDAMQQSKVWKITHIRSKDKEVADPQKIEEINRQLESNVNKGKDLEFHVYVK